MITQLVADPPVQVGDAWIILVSTISRHGFGRWVYLTKTPRAVVLVGAMPPPSR